MAEDTKVTTVTDEATGEGTPVFNDKGLEKIGRVLKTKFEQYVGDRRNAEKQWLKNLRQRKGVYDPVLLQQLENTKRSKAYPRITRMKCVGMLSKLMNLLFQGGSEKNWTIGVSPVPNLHVDDLQEVLNKLQTGKDPNQPLSDEEIEEAIREFAKVRALNLEHEIDDQLKELGGNRMSSYTTLARQVLKSGIDFGMGVLKGPFVEEREQRTWVKDTDDKLVASKVIKFRPKFEFVPLWNYYPDMSALALHQMEGQFQTVVMSKHMVIALKKRPDFIADKVDAVLQRMPKGNHKLSEADRERRDMGNQSNVTEHDTGKYQAVCWTGFVSGRMMRDAGLNIKDDRLNEDVRAEIWQIGDIVIKAQMDPWGDLLEGDTIQMYHHFIFEEDDTTIVGQGLPAIVRDSQMGVNAATRMTLDNGSVQRNLEVNVALLSNRTNQDVSTITTDKVWLREDTGPSAAIPAVRNIDLPMHLAEMQQIITLFTKFADEETFVTSGTDIQKGPSEPFRTAAGASMLRGEAALPFKDVVRNFDVFTSSVIQACIKFNKAFSEDTKIRGDFEAIARGATSLIAKEVLGIQLDNLATTLTDEEKRYVNFRNLITARVRVRDIDVEDVVVTPAEAKRIDEQAAQEAQEQKQQVAEMFQAELRKLLGESFKDVTQANKNTVAADVQQAQVVLEALEKGLEADDVTRTREETIRAAEPDATGSGAESSEEVVGGPLSSGFGQAGAVTR
jgi:hypothetical protein